MKERFEFTDGSYYEFERWTEEDIRRVKARSVYSSWWISMLGDESELNDTKAVPPQIRIKIRPMDLFRTKYDTCALAGQKYKAKQYAPGEVNQDVIGVALTADFRTANAQVVEFASGIYLPIKFNHNEYCNLFVALNTIKSKVIYEPKLIFGFTSQALKMKNK